MSDLKIFTDVIEQEALNQIYTLIKQPTFSYCKVRIMPDVHAGSGCVIGFTADLGDKVIPNIVGVDIGCGMLTTNLGKVDLDLKELDDVIRKYVPSGRNTHVSPMSNLSLEKLHCFEHLKDIDRIQNSIGTLGGGNHFIEVDTDDDGNKYLIIHTGSRNLGKQVADYYQNLAIDLMQGKDELYKKQTELINEYKKSGKSKEISSAIKELQRTFKPNKLNIPKELCYLEGKYRDMYLHDMILCQEYAIINRLTIQFLIMSNIPSIGYSSQVSDFETIHNYIDHNTNIVRKGAISAKKDELLLIPINMRDGCILGRGKGNEDWNCSAPHGAGRLMSRSKAKELLSIEEFKSTMEGIYTTCVGQSTLDESPMAYKSINDILDNIKDTVDIVKIIKPIYNFKASE